VLGNPVKTVRVKIIAERQIRKGWRDILAVVGLLLLLSNSCYGAMEPTIDCSGTQGSELTECAQDGPISTNLSKQLAELTEFLESWLNAWGRGDIDAYFSHYMANQSPIAGLSRPQWEKQRRRSVAPARHIQVSIELESMGIDAQNVIDVVFLQRYSAKGYQDLTKKRIYLVRQGDQLKISREEVLDR
jgi:hypothetical protein